jgi:hypothetical protein
VAEEDLGELRHGNDVANAAARVQNDGLLHFSTEKKLGAPKLVGTSNKYFGTNKDEVAYCLNPGMPGWLAAS